jgi:beta-lactam-binding protein with PASTA domain
MKSRPNFTLQSLAILAIFCCLSLILPCSVALATPLARLESPAPEAFLRSGIALIRGWSCDAGRVEVSIDGGPLLATAQGTDRPDTAQTCGRTDTGFGLIYNWNRVGDGVHELRAFVGGVEFADVNFTVATLGGEFLTGLRGDYTVPDFPAPGDSAKIGWSEPHQNFVFVSPVTVPPVANPPKLSGAALESPVQGSSESGIGLIRGWVCTAGKVEVSLDGGPRMATAHGTDRPDTAGTCGRADTGFGLTFNWNRAGDGVHNLRAFADGVEFADVNFAVTTLGGEFLTGLLDKIRLLGFPNTGTAASPQAASGTDPATSLEWSEPDQNFVITASTTTGAKIATVAAITDILNKFAVLGIGSNLSNTLGVHAVKGEQGQPTAIDGVTWADANSETWADLSLGTDGLPSVYKDSTGVEARLDQFTATSVVIRFFDSSGQPKGGPVTTPINSGLLQDLQQLVNQLREASGVAAPLVADNPSRPYASLIGADGAASAAPDALRFSLNALLVKLFGSGGIAAGETLCALQSAAAVVGLGNAIAATGCQSPLITDFLALANTPTSQASAMDAALDLRLQRSLQFVQDIADAPCAPPGDSTGCLIPAASALRSIAAAPVREIRPDQPSPDISVPNVVGLSQSIAATALNNAGLTVGSITRQASTTVPAGTVIRQNPAAGASVAPGSAVDLVVSSGPAPVVVPSVVGLAQSGAATALNNAGLTVGSITQQTNSTVPAGTVISQNPTAGASVAPGSAVDLVVSSGPASITVPNVVGLAQNAAAAALQKANLTVGSITRQTSTSVPAGSVISQNPAAGTSVAPGSAVDLVVSSGPPPVTVPSVVGQTQNGAAAVLQKSGLTVGTVTQQTSTSVPAGSVISQNPAAGTSVAPGSAVDLVVSLGPPVTVPNVVGQTQSTATAVLQRFNLTVGSVTRQVTPGVAPGIVLSQNPAAGTSVAAGTAVDLVVSAARINLSPGAGAR